MRLPAIESYRRISWGILSPVVAGGLLASTLLAAPPAHATLTCGSPGLLLINNEADLRALAADDDCWAPGFTFVQENDIALTSPWTIPIGNSTIEFSGTYDGNLKKITGLTGPLFGVVDGGLITGVTIEESTVVGNGAIVGTLLSGEVWSSAVLADVENSADGVGGIVGEVGKFGASDVSATLRDLSFSGDIEGANGVGGIAGQVWGNVNLTLTNVSASGSVTGEFGVGGAVGLVEAGTTSISISESESNATVTQSVGDAFRAWAGGLVGAALRSGSGVITFDGNSAAGDVTAEDNGAGGLVGTAQGNIEITSSSASGDIVGQDDIGGLVGYFNGSSSRYHVTSSHATGNVRGNASVGGLVGTGEHVAIDDSYATGSVNGVGDEALLGGFVGYLLAGSTITDSHATGNVVLLEDEGYATGGFFGLAKEDTQITRSFSTGSVDGRLGDNTGGFGGWLMSGSVEQSYALGTVMGSDFTGGLIGYAGLVAPAEISDSYAHGQVTGSRFVGAIIGSAQDGTVVNRTYGSGPVSGSSSVGGAFGEVYEDGSPTSASQTHWNSQESGLSNSVGAIVGDPVFANVTGLTTVQMRTSSSFTGWDFSSVWGYQCSSSIYPQLRAINSNATATSCPIPSPDSGGGTQPAPSSPTITPPASSAEALGTLAATAPAPQQPGAASMLIGGQPVAVLQTPQRRGQGIELSAGPVTFQLRSQTPSGRGVPTSPDGSLVIASSGTLPITGDGLLPGSLFTQTLNSDPIDLGTATVGTGGTFSSDTSIPASAPKGDHTLTLTGTTKDGDPFTLAIGVVVTSPAAALGASPIVTTTPAKLTPGGHVNVKATGVQARCTVTFILGNNKSRTAANARGIAVTSLTVPAGNNRRMSLTTNVSGKGCEPVALTRSLRR